MTRKKSPKRSRPVSALRQAKQGLAQVHGMAMSVAGFCQTLFGALETFQAQMGVPNEPEEASVEPIDPEDLDA